MKYVLPALLGPTRASVPGQDRGYVEGKPLLNDLPKQTLKPHGKYRKQIYEEAVSYRKQT
jgi:hypothetical protein